MGKSNAVYRLISNIPSGKVATYGQIGSILKIHPRQVGRILHLNSDPKSIPCHRVVNFKGEVARNYAFGGGDAQRKKLEEEGIIFVGNKVELQKYKWEDAVSPKGDPSGQ